ncbi:MAG: phosphatidate cytidylyltransferase [Planctomycetota bacterium]
MSPEVRQRLFGVRDAFDSPIVTYGLTTIAAVLILTPLLVLLLHRLGKLGDKDRRELLLRCGSWAVIVPCLLGPIVLGAAAWILAVGVLSALCFREFSRITGLFREPLLVAVTYAGIASITFGALDHWYAWFTGTTPVTLALLAATALLKDRPDGYVQRVALAILGFTLFGTGLGHLAFLANDAEYRPLLFILLVAVQANDVFAYLSGRLFGKRKLCPNTSPNKTRAGALGALLLTTTLVVTLGNVMIPGVMDQNALTLLLAGVLLSLTGQAGDLVLSSIKRDIGIKDTGALLPGHGGLLDRFDSLLLATPTVFYFLAYTRGIGLDQPTQIFTG